MARAAGAGAPLKYLALGDSYTIGESVPEAGRWPVQLVAALRERGVAIDEPRIIATTGWTTDELAAAMDAAEPLGRWDVVSLLIGVNNQYRGRDVADYRGEFTALLQRAITLAGGRADHVLVLSIPDWGVTPFGQASGRDPARIAAELDAYNAAAASICEAHGVPFVDITPASRAPTAGIAEDGLHPSAPQYTTWTHLTLEKTYQVCFLSR
ncbi:SGNH/GDSL hydrolase family protein [Arenimonas sp. MALMAid1274]|uniref:SGNH/GDSL hydrolase family protein n=1 Tax=Arenimonas sp. MALMAid1274 TaxID=3411630 RepID=UPI003BA0017C